MTYPESDKEIFNDLVKTGLSGVEALDAIENTQKIAERCNVELPKAPRPKYVVDQEKDWKNW